MTSARPRHRRTGLMVALLTLIGAVLAFQIPSLRLIYHRYSVDRIACATFNSLDPLFYRAWVQDGYRIVDIGKVRVAEPTTDGPLYSQGPLNLALSSRASSNWGTTFELKGGDEVYHLRLGDLEVDVDHGQVRLPVSPHSWSVREPCLILVSDHAVQGTFSWDPLVVPLVMRGELPTR